jgi:putative addiction module component (TIGR02574 family)
MKETAAVLEEVLRLPPEDRAEFAARLLESLHAESQDEIDEAWALEIERRCAAVDDGTLQTSDWSEVRACIEREVFGR